MSKIKIRVCMVLCMVLIGLGVRGDIPKAAAAEKLEAPQGVCVTRKSDKALRLRWKAVKGASGYVISRKEHGKKRYKKVKMVAGGKKRTWTDKKVKTGKTYTYVVKAYKKEKGKKNYGNNSMWVSAKADKRSDRTVNAGKVKLKKNLTLGLRMTAKCGAKLSPQKYKKGKGKKVISPKIRYRSSDSRIAAVDSKGVVTAGIDTGSCYIYAMAHNGITAKMKVTVVDYARPANFMYYDGRVKEINVLLNEYKEEVCNIASYFTKHKVADGQETYIKVTPSGEITFTPGNVECEEIRKDLEKLLISFPTYIHIYVTDCDVSFYMDINPNKLTITQEVIFSFDEDLLDWDGRQMAPHWAYLMQFPD